MLEARSEQLVQEYEGFVKDNIGSEIQVDPEMREIQGARAGAIDGGNIE